MRPSSRLLAVLAALLLLVVGCGDASPGGDAAATVDGEPIPRSQLEEAVRELTADAPEDDPEAVAETQRQVLTFLIQARIIEDLAEAEDIEIDDADIEERYETDVEQAGGEEAFEEMLAMQSFTLELYRDVLVPTQLRVDEMRQRLAADEPPYEARTVRHILVETEDEATEIIGELEDGADFGALAEERSIDTGSGAQGGELGAAARGAYVDEFDDAAWEAEIDEIVGPVETQFGFHVIQVTAAEETPASELDVQTLDQLVGEELGMQIGAAFTEAEVEVDPAFGRWDPEATAVVSTEPVGEGGDQPAPAPGGGDGPEGGVTDGAVEPGDGGEGELGDGGEGELGDGGEGELDE